MLFPGAIYGHGIYLDDKDWELMAGTGAGIAHCPTANFMLESGIIDLSAAFAHKVPVGLGSDIGAGGATAICRVAEAAVYGQSARKVFGKPYSQVTAEQAFYMMTLGGAAAMGLSDRIGSLEPGKEADFIVLDPRPCLPLGQWSDDTQLCELIWALILRFRVASVENVYIGGYKVSPSS
jgi:guanine deaminase